jgi:hypothetical protein
MNQGECAECASGAFPGGLEKECANWRIVGSADPGRAVFPVAGGGPDVKANIPLPDPFRRISLSRVTGSQ